MKEVLKLIKTISVDVWILFRNFIHWNISKALISLASICLWFLLATPFLILLLIIYFSFGLNEYLTSFDVSLLDLLGLLWGRPFIFFLFMLLALLVFISVLIGYGYRKVLFTKLNLSYIDWKKLIYLKNKYFDFILIFRYFQVIAYISLIVSIPVILFFIIFFILFFTFWWGSWVQTMINSSQFNVFTLLVLITMLVCFIAFVYISYRLYFAVIMLVDKKHYEEEEKPMFYLKESFLKTKSIFVFMKFVLVIIIGSIIVMPFSSLQNHFSDSLKEVRAFREYSLLGEDEKNIVDENEKYDFLDDIKVKYSSLTIEKIKSIEVTYFYLNYILVIFNFLIIFGLLEMVVVSFYKHEIIRNKTFLSNLIS